MVEVKTWFEIARWARVRAGQELGFVDPEVSADRPLGGRAYCALASYIEHYEEPPKDVVRLVLEEYLWSVAGTVSRNPLLMDPSDLDEATERLRAALKKHKVIAE